MKDNNAPAFPLPVTATEVEALLDGQLAPETEKSVWFVVRNDPCLYSRYKKLEAQKSLLAAWWQAESPDSRFDLLFN
ncbi:MAG: hypothetical protein GC185_10445 [Alphaproteobacteria bacterium]|nr:hypothetical protein [Alphaproteobacteria bacterium]